MLHAGIMRSMRDGDRGAVFIDQFVIRDRKLVSAGVTPAIRRDYIDVCSGPPKRVNQTAAVVRVHVILVPATDVGQLNWRLLCVRICHRSILRGPFSERYMRP
jgi:hypothetical protein